MEDPHSYLRNRANVLEIKLHGPQAFALWVILILVFGMSVMEISRIIGNG